MAWTDRIAALLGISAYQPAPRDVPSLDSRGTISVRKSVGGQIQPLPQSQPRWYLADLEFAEAQADVGNIAQAARLMRSARKDGVYSGVLSTRTDGLVRLPKRFRGDPNIVEALEVGGEEARSVFDEMCPAAELAALVADGIELGVGVAELVPVEGRDYPVLVRLDPEFLYYVWADNRWYFRSIAGLIPIVPGDGRWVLHTPGGRIAPWQRGLWRAIGRAYIRKEHANLHKDNWEGKLANPARVAIAPQGATEPQKESWFRRVMAWGVNTVFGLTPGYDVKLLESNGRGYECFQATIADQNNEFIMAVCGQTVTTDGGAGFSNADVHRSIRADLIKATADALAYTINTQILPSWIWSRFGEDALVGESGALLEFDVTPPKDSASEANALVTAATAITTLAEALSARGLELDVDALTSRFGIPVVRSSQQLPSTSSSSNDDIEDAEIVDLESWRASA